MRTPSFTAINDHSAYVFLARAFRYAHYHEIWRVDAAWHARDTPLFPGFLAALIAIGGEQLDVMHAALIAWSATGLGFIFAVVRRLWEPSVADAVVATVGEPNLV
jgi:hypothetical protein